MQNSSSRKSFIEHNVEKEDILYLIYDLIEKDYLQPMEQGGLIIGLEGEKIINNYEFYAVFPSEEEWIVMHESEKIGHVEEIHYAGEKKEYGRKRKSMNTRYPSMTVIFRISC